MKGSGITLDELIAEWRTVEYEGTGGKTTEEIAEEMGVAQNTARTYIKRALINGTLTNGTELRPTIMRPGYSHLANVFIVVKK